ncbi:MAG: Tim44/TimA family putative adaptor protein [Pseudomonadota bacterium]
MGSSIIQLLVLAGIAVFLILRLRSVLGTREGFEKPPVPMSGGDTRRDRPEFDVIEGGVDRDITDHVKDGTDAAHALAAMKIAEPGFSVSEFLDGARGAYEMILMAFENGDIAEIRGFIDPEIADAFQSVVDQRNEAGLTVHANFVGIRELTLADASMNRDTAEGEITVRFVGEMTSVVKNADGDIVEGSATEIKRQRDVWTFARRLGVDDPNWILVATDE